MRSPGENAAGQAPNRRRGRSGSGSPSRPGQRGGQDQPGGESSVFSPGYRTAHRAAAGPADDTRRTAGYGWAGGAATKGPVRGFPPAPGQPPPLYPPGQFSAWNQSAAEPESGPVSAPWAADDQAAAGRHGAGPGQPGYPAAPGHDEPGGGAWPGPAAGEERGGHPEAGFEPGYSVLAISDPAADVTSTQSWGRVDDDRETGAWIAPRGPAPGRHAPDRAALPRRAAAPGPAAPARGGAASRPVTAAPGPDAPEGLDGLGEPGQGRPQADLGGRTAGRGSARRAAAGPPAAGRAAGGREAGGRGARSRARKRGRPIRLLAGGLALLLVLGTAAYLVLKDLHHGSVLQPGAAGTGASPGQSASPSASPTPTPPPGPWRFIGTRVEDPAPLTLAELFPVTFTAGGTYTRTVRRSGKACGSAVIGSALQSAVRGAGCTQVLRASYLSLGKKQMGTIGVLNLRTFRAAKRAGRAAGAAQFIEPLDGRKGPTRNLAKAAGLEEAEVKGHYLILVLADFSNLRAPRSKAQRRALEAFMSELIKQTVNVSLTSRMVTGKPQSPGRP